MNRKGPWEGYRRLDSKSHMSQCRHFVSQETRNFSSNYCNAQENITYKNNPYFLKLLWKRFIQRGKEALPSFSLHPNLFFKSIPSQWNTICLFSNKPLANKFWGPQIFLNRAPSLTCAYSFLRKHIIYQETLSGYPDYGFRGSFLERRGNFSGSKANFKIKTCWTVAQSQAHKHNEQKTTFRARKGSGSFKKQAADFLHSRSHLESAVGKLCNARK